ncbi:membrane associated rhomboid family serine protease [Saccharopolyspora lacisalsi]|uniref:Membrane associated rhomboid family serine protease n=1 Tax=Halosaccharopolyspora lacisalsi TaxID=1000566 RepID=A0A839DQ41_9PSEU|nr:rhomboid family intramembrane serine protease [Halosaccharopolyspora lacisalsi]MBA8823100.1 membrane associated rhomboid family serine protease [Halosaccharopolyspora lacisalsi]
MASNQGRRPRVVPAKPLRAAFVVLGFVVVLYLVELIDTYFVPAELESNGIDPRSVGGLDGILWAPLLHGGWDHLLANTVPLLVLGWLALSGGIRQFVAVTAVVWIVGGLGTWLIGADSVHIGASGLAFGWMVFLLVRGFFNRSFAQIAVAVLLFAYWGGMLWGVLPGQPGVSWSGHLFGAVGGLVAAWLVTRANRRSGSRSSRSRSAGTMSP